MSTSVGYSMKTTQIGIRTGEEAGPYDGLPVATGSVVDGKFVVERIIGAGAMGVVVSAVHRELGMRVALKFLLPTVLRQYPDAVERFAREGQAAARVTCEHVVKVLDVARLASGVPYLVMELVEGEDLEAILARNERLPVDRAVDYIVQASVALAEAHVSGVVHRDLKPSNLFLAKRSDGTTIVKVLDFGISTINSETSPDTQTTIGTPLYMSPEQFTSANTVDQRSDVWALGMVLHELLTGEPAFLAGTVTEVCARILSSMPPPPASSRRPDVPAGLEVVIRRALAKKANDRYANVGEMARDLLPFAPPSARANLDRILRIFRTSGTWVPSAAPPSILELRDAYVRNPPSVAPTPLTEASAPRRLRGASRLAIALVASIVAVGSVGVVRRLNGAQRSVAVAPQVDGAPSLEALPALSVTEPPAPVETHAVAATVPAQPIAKWTVVRKDSRPAVRPKVTVAATAAPTDLYGGRK